MKAGDVIVAIQAKPVTTGRELVRAMEAIEPGDKVELGLKRDGKPLKLAVEARPLDHALLRRHTRRARAQRDAGTAGDGARRGAAVRTATCTGCSAAGVTPSS